MKVGCDALAFQSVRPFRESSLLRGSHQRRSSWANTETRNFDREILGISAPSSSLLLPHLSHPSILAIFITSPNLYLSSEPVLLLDLLSLLLRLPRIALHLPHGLLPVLLYTVDCLPARLFQILAHTALLSTVRPRLHAPRKRREEQRTKHAEERRDELPREHEVCTAPGEDEADELVGLVEVILGGDVVLLIGGVLLELEDRRQGDRGPVRGDRPDGEDLGDVDIEGEVLLVVRCFPEGAIQYHLAQRGDFVLTNAIHFQLDLRAHDLVPPEDVVDQLPAVVEAARAAEGMRKGGIGREVLVQRRLLLFRRRLRETMDDVRNFFNGVIHGGDIWIKRLLCDSVLFCRCARRNRSGAGVHVANGRNRRPFPLLQLHAQRQHCITCMKHEPWRRRHQARLELLGPTSFTCVKLSWAA